MLSDQRHVCSAARERCRYRSICCAPSPTRARTGDPTHDAGYEIDPRARGHDRSIARTRSPDRGIGGA